MARTLWNAAAPPPAAAPDSAAQSVPASEGGALGESTAPTLDLDRLSAALAALDLPLFYLPPPPADPANAHAPPPGAPAAPGAPVGAAALVLSANGAGGVSGAGGGSNAGGGAGGREVSGSPG
ncbi:hypothetical protein T484DRAFT_1923096, partial [Baffinella frigidus]